MFRPKVSIVIPAYNAANYLAEAIDSALAQTYSNIEIIVVNDGSSDNGATAAVAAKYGDKIRYFEKANGGSSSALNEGIRRMNGEWFSWLSHDDLYYPTKVEKQIAYLQELAQSGQDYRKVVMFAQGEAIDGSGHLLRKPSVASMHRLTDEIAGFSDNRYLIADSRKYSFNGCSCLVHRSIFEHVGMFDEGLRLLNDTDMWYRVLTAGYHVVVLPDILVKNRVHKVQVSRSIGYSWRNSEQEWYLKRSLQWLKENCGDDCDVISRFGNMAYMSENSAIGDKAYQYLCEQRRISKIEAALNKLLYKTYGNARAFAKKVYIHLIIDRKTA